MICINVNLPFLTSPEQETRGIRGGKSELQGFSQEGKLLRNEEGKEKKITRELCEGLFQNTALDNDHDSK